MICMLSFSFLVGSKTVLATTFLYFLQLCLAPKLVKAKASTFSALVSNPVMCWGPQFSVGFHLWQLKWTAPGRTEILGTAISTGARCGVRFSSLGTVTCLEGFAYEQEASCTPGWSNELFQCYIDYHENFPMQSYYYLFIPDVLRICQAEKGTVPAPRGACWKLWYLDVCELPLWPKAMSLY